MPGRRNGKHPLRGGGDGYTTDVAVVTRVIEAPPERVFGVLADGWTYSDWVVGTAHIRDVDPDWPAPGTRLLHKVGPWPVSLRDESTVVASVPDKELTLRVGIWPLGEATVYLRLEPFDSGSTKVVMYEEFHAGPLGWVQNKLNDLVLHRRNVESLRRLADIATRSTTRRKDEA